jgi:hypothetical protein
MGHNPKVPSSLAAATLFVLVLVLTSWISTQANPTSVMDFEGIPEGTIVDSVYSGYGVSGDIVEGSIDVHGLTTHFGPDVNTAMIFDSTCSPGGTPADCKGSGEGGDLFKPELGNVLIISKDLDSSDPDDADWVGSYYEFDFSGFGSGTVTVVNIAALDVEDEEDEGGALIEVYSGGKDGTLLKIVDIPDVGDNGLKYVDVNVTGVDFMRVTLNGSGAIDNVQIEAENVPTASPTPPTLTPTEPTAVKLLYFRVEGVNGLEATLSWRTAAEIDHYGFNLYRSPDANLENASLIHFEPAAWEPGGTLYTYKDITPASGQWWYWLSDVDTSGTETFDEAFSPVEVLTTEKSPASAPFRIFLPISISNTGP